MMWGRHRENGIWRARESRRRIIWRGHDSLYVAFGKTQLRIMKPSRRRPR